MNTNALRTCAALLVLSACTVDPIIGHRDAGVSEGDGETGDGADGAPGDGSDGATGDGETGVGSDGATGDGEAGDGSDGSTGELPECPRGGFLTGENSCTVCCVVDGDILEWCEDLPCTACVEGDLEIEPGATKHRACNTCLCQRDGSVTCTQNDCDVDCDSDSAACPWRTGSAYHVQYDRGDGFTLSDSDFEGVWVHGPNGSVPLDRAQVEALNALLAAPALRDFARNGTGDCPALDGYWSELRSGEQASWKGRFAITLAPEDGAGERYTRMLTGQCQVPALAPLDAFLEQLAP